MVNVEMMKDLGGIKNFTGTAGWACVCLTAKVSAHWPGVVTNTAFFLSGALARFDGCHGTFVFEGMCQCFFALAWADRFGV